MLGLRAEIWIKPVAGALHRQATMLVRRANIRMKEVAKDFNAESAEGCGEPRGAAEKTVSLRSRRDTPRFRGEEDPRTPLGRDFTNVQTGLPCDSGIRV